MVTVREATSGDREFLLTLLNGTPELLPFEDYAYDASYVEDALENGLNLVLIAEEKEPLGLLVGEIWKKRGFGFIQNLAILPEARKQGVGTALFKRFQEECASAGVETIGALTKESNRIMQSWMGKHGFSQAKEKLFYYEKR